MYRQVDRQPLWSWMEDNLRFKDSPYGQRFRVDATPWLKLPLECQQDVEVQEIVICAAAQMGKTVLIQGGLAWSLAEDPAPTMVAIDTLEAAKDLAENKLNPVLESCPKLADIMPQDKTAKKKLRIHFPQSHLLIGPANNSFLRSHSIKRGYGDECAKWPDGAMANFRARAKRFPNRQFVLGSTPLEEAHDFWQSWLAGTREEWAVQCQGCGELFIPTFRDTIQWREDKVTRPGGAWDFKAVKETVVMECPSCRKQHQHTPETLRSMNDGGGYVETNPEASGKVRSFRFNSLILPPSVLSWGDLVEEFLKAKDLANKGFTQPLKEFVNLQLAEPWRAEEHIDDELIEIADYVPTDAWSKEARRYMTVDCQKDLADFWVVVRAWARGGDSRLLTFRRPRSFDEIETIAAEFQIPPNRVFVDVGYKRTEVVYELAKRGWHGLQGDDKETFLHKERKKDGSQRSVWKIFSTPKPERGLNLPKAPHVWMWSNPAVKDILQKLKLGKGSRWEVCDVGNLTEQYQIQLNSERKQLYRRGGRDVYVWEQIGHRPNHGWDCECMQIVVAVIQKLYGTE